MGAKHCTSIKKEKTATTSLNEPTQCGKTSVDVYESSPVTLSVQNQPMPQTTNHIPNTFGNNYGPPAPQPLSNVQRGKKESALWEFEGDNGFQFYKKKDCELIETAYQQGNSTIKIKVGGKKYEIDFNKMMQTNTVTKYSRKVNRISLNDEALNFQLITWKVKLDFGVILAYDDNVNQSIEKAYSQKNPSFITVIKGKKYIIDFGKMKQINQATLYERDLLREVIAIPSSPLWLWLDDSNKYSGYSKESSKKIEDQFQAKVKKFNLSISQTNYEIDFVKFTQTNLDSNEARRIKRVPLEVLLDSEVWEWKDARGFVSYKPSETSTIKKAYESKQQILSFTVNKNWYTIDLYKMVQINDSTNQSRTIRRVPPVPPLPKLTANLARVAVGTLWEYESDNGYVKYSEVFCNNLNAIFNSGNNTYFYNYEGTPFMIDFTKMVQINQDTQRARTIRNSTSNLAISSVTPGCKLVVLDSYSADYKKIKNLFDKTMSGKYKNITITLLINPNTKKRYDNCVSLLETEGGAPPKTLLLFHGTRDVDPKRIYDGYYENFDVACADAGLWGKGVHFATDAFYSTSHVYKNNDESCSMLVAEVAVGNYYDYGTNNDNSLLYPPNLPNNNYKRYDSVSGITEGTRVYIIYNSNQAYSKYLITYSV